jgi:hypothetical protein
MARRKSVSVTVRFSEDDAAAIRQTAAAAGKSYTDLIREAVRRQGRPWILTVGMNLYCGLGENVTLTGLLPPSPEPAP